jgi:hypothetical protein
MEKTNMEKTKLSGEILYQLGHKNETYENVSLALATRQRIRDFSNLSSLEYELRHNGLKIDHDQFMQYWKDWQAAGLGQLHLARNKKKMRFSHYYDMRTIAAAALAGKDVEVQMRKQEDVAVATKQRAEQLDSIAKSISKSLEVAAQKPEIAKKIEQMAKKDPTTTLNKARLAVATKAKSKKTAPAVASLRAASKSAQTVFNRILVALRPGVFVDLVIPQDATTGEIDLIREALNKLAPAGAYKAA